MTTRLVILSGLLLCGSLASGKNELSFKETVVPVKVAPDQDNITASFSLGFILPWTKATLRSGNTSDWSFLAYSVTALRSSGSSPFSSTIGQTM